ncbi:LysR family transcriptional regulator [Anaerovibrio lipolyticus]|jgi:DNA-binding transcriptional LysR family regulator|uniref:LysR family transcriptional regulator n=1 Tax=Anaerovibrio lipolyticus TaxID=82374 RepID=A0A0B2JX49_9FIRM|nr:LysR family transcriptional regulator [Anaerovibrio lipolyticus]KHM52900.1 LysR family transcriptional regulator [Anaerovibrio lipolyticus]MBQ1855128.1 LysR family transcriptional regulator [Anaerovibrio sp.]
MELRQLEYFQMASRLKNITRAAERLNVSQPNITVAIKKLEAELGIQLFDRSQKQLSLTPEGTIFLNRIELALRNIQDAVLEVNDYKQLQKGTIKIGIPSMIGAYLFPRIFSSFQHLYPHLDIYLYEEGSMTIREQLERDELDFGIVILSDASSSLQLLPMARNQIVACVPEEHPLARKNSININDISEADLIMLKEGSFLRYMVLNKLKMANISPNIVLESNQIETIKGLVSTNVGISFLLDFIVKGTPGIKILPFEDPIYVDLGLAWKKERYISKAAQSFIDFCKNTLNEHH